ncbi:MAG: efflux RND transporter permease subunit, partial [Planctomycetota bacterium]
VDINRDRAQRLGIALPTIFDTLQTNLGSAYVNDFNLFGRTFQVRAQAESEFRMSQQDLLDLKVRNASGSEVPISTLATVRETAGPAVVYRYNLFSAATITGSGAPGVSSGQALSEMQQIADQTLPPGFGFEWTSLAYQQIASGNLAPLVFALAIVFVYFFLAAQYESWSVPLTIMATIPNGVLGAMLATLARGMDNNVYTQIGLVLLVALVCKNAILIVEFAEQLRKQGKPLREATLEASSLRYRPILMTALSFVLGTAPLLIASGAGASSRLAIGTAVFGGMVLATFVGIFFIPVMYLIVRTVFKGKRIEAAA